LVNIVISGSGWTLVSVRTNSGSMDLHLL